MAALTNTTFKPTVQPKLVLVAMAIDKHTGLSVPCSIPAWRLDSSGNVVIDSIGGLSPGGSYDVTFLVLG